MKHSQKLAKFALVISIIPHIQYLVRHNDCVVLPGFGALIAHRIGARIENGVMFPPSRTLGFNPSVCHNDAMLASSVARKEGLSYAAAVSAVTSAIDELRRVYDVAGVMTIPRVGTFTRTSEGTMEFTPDRDDCIASGAFYGFPAISLTTADDTSEVAGEVLPSRYLSTFRRVMRVAASVIVLVALGVALSTPVLVERDGRHYASLSLPEIAAAHAVVLPEVQAPVEEREMYLAIPAAELTTSASPSGDNLSAQNPVVSSSVRMNPADRYFLVVASYETAAQARLYVAQRPSENLAVLETPGRCRVYAATGSSVAEARVLMDDPSFRELHPDGWVHKH
ncbi:MAG: hypothetical protein HDS57_05055 [Barnesiella sp.]|nr:hypothetical protein [Barnesiella sp.]